MYLMKRTGEWLGFDDALALSLPRDEIDGPQTIESGRETLIASYDCASVCSKSVAAASWPPLYCGCQKRLTFGSLPTMKFFTLGNAWPTSPTNAANCACAPAFEPIAAGCSG